MTGNGFSVEIETLRAEAQSMYTAVEQAKNEIEALMAAMNTLNASWSGTANEVFRRNFILDYENAVTGCENLRHTVDKIDDAGKKYRICEDQVLQRVARL